MNLAQWIGVVIGVIGCVKLLIDALFKIARWTSTVEHGVEQKPKVTLDRLSWDLEQIGKDIRDLRTSVDGRYGELAGKVTADHQLVRELRDWKAGLYTELATHFYSISMIDRMAKESEADRKTLWDELEQLKVRVYGGQA